MRLTNCAYLAAAALIWAGWQPLGAQAAALGTTFTYQGVLQQNGEPFNGSAGFIFGLYSTATGGSPIVVRTFDPAIPPHQSPIQVVGGRFTVDLDFGPDAFNGEERWLNIVVIDPPGSSLLSPLSPRQRLNATPYALQTRGLYVSNSNQVGIGTTTPTSKLHVSGGNVRIDAGSDTNPGLTITSASNGFGSGIFLDNATANGKQWSIYSDQLGNLVFGDEDNQVAAMHIRYESGNPITSVKVMEITGGSDLAEAYDIAPAGEVAPTPGMVVVVDSERVGKLRVSEGTYDRRVAGVISGANGVNPGLLLGQKGTLADGELPVANVGRVWCLADADANGPIEAGDLLTSAATPGHAMKVTEHDRANGAVIGKAMSSLESGRGYVLVLVSLQ